MNLVKSADWDANKKKRKCKAEIVGLLLVDEHRVKHIEVTKGDA